MQVGAQGTNDEGFRLRNQPALDGIRAFAVVAVMVCHAFPQYAGGGYGVDVFFCLSGFLITSLLLGEWRTNERVHLRYFWARRALRLLPALLLMLAAVSAYSVFVASPALRDETLGALPAVLFYFANWWRALGHHSLGMLGPTWSLSVEEQFYLLWPLLLVLTLHYARRPRRWLLLITATGCAFALVDRLMLFGNNPELDLVRLNGADARADQLLAGCALAVVCAALSPRGRTHLRRLFAVLFLPAVLGFAWLFVYTKRTGFAPDVIYTFGFTALALASVVVIGHVALSPRSLAARFLALWPLRSIGRISYGLYLWHFPVFIVVAVHSGIRTVAPRTAAAFGATLATATTSYFVLEHPLLKRKERFRARAALPTAATTARPLVTVNAHSNGRRPWDADDVAALLDGLADETPLSVLSERLGRSPQALQAKARRLGIPSR